MVLIQDKIKSPINGDTSNQVRQNNNENNTKVVDASYDPAQDDLRGHFVLESGSVRFKDANSFDKDFALETLKQVVTYAKQNSIELFDSPSKRNELTIRLCKMFCWPTDLVNTTIDLDVEMIKDLDESFGIDMNKKVKANLLSFEDVEYTKTDDESPDLSDGSYEEEVFE